MSKEIYYQEQGQNPPSNVYFNGVDASKFPWWEDVKLWLRENGYAETHFLSHSVYHKYLLYHRRSFSEWLTAINKPKITIGKIKVDINKCVNDLDQL